MLWLDCRLRQLEFGHGAPGSTQLPLDAGKSQSKEPETPFPPLGPVAVDPKGCVTITIHTKPGSKQKAVTTWPLKKHPSPTQLEGKANAELCQYFSKVLELRKSDVVFLLKLLASTTAEVILEKLKQQVD
ncbi:unnamed protein product [Nyctereutes procyonoides]|uniref:(raccoon dog) hypothetical protein n=1 Tax=Nyctereutes procyonoides TaxID=34880 RepID=A0A811Y469_NYCPR|nr:unnamed protein product [Nyctereutes procyonoides]